MDEGEGRDAFPSSTLKMSSAHRSKKVGIVEYEDIQNIIVQLSELCWTLGSFFLFGGPQRPSGLVIS